MADSRTDCIVAECPRARISLPHGTFVSHDFPELVATFERSRLILNIEPDPVLWATEVIQWDQNEQLIHNPQLELARSRARHIPYLGRESVVEARSSSAVPPRYTAKVLLTDPQLRRRAQADFFGSGEAKDFDATWQRSIESFEFLGSESPIDSCLGREPAIEIDDECLTASATLLASLDLDEEHEGWVQARMGGQIPRPLLLLHVAASDEYEQDVTQYPIAKVLGTLTRAGGASFFSSLAEAIAHARDSYNVKPTSWTVAAAPESPALLAPSALPEMDYYSPTRQREQQQ